MIELLGAAAWHLDRFGGRKFGGTGLKVLWLAFFAKLALPFGLLALVSWSTVTAAAQPSAAPPAGGVKGTWLTAPVPGLLPLDLPSASGLPFAGEGTLGFLLAVPAVVLLVLLAVRVVQAGRSLSRLPEIGGTLKLRTDALARNLGLRKPVRLLRSASRAFSRLLGSLPARRPAPAGVGGPDPRGRTRPDSAPRTGPSEEP